MVCASRHAFIEKSIGAFRSGIIVKCFFLVLSCTCHLQTKLNLCIERERIKQIHEHQATYQTNNQPASQATNKQTQEFKFSSLCLHTSARPVNEAVKLHRTKNMGARKKNQK